MQEELPPDTASPAATTEDRYDQIVVAHVVDGRPGQAQTLLAHQYSPAGNYPFCLAWKGNDPISELSNLLLLLFHPYYATSEKGKPIFINEQDIAYRKKLEQVFSDQRLEVEIISMSNVTFLDREDPDPAAAYLQYCNTSYIPEDVFALSGGDLECWNKILQSADRELAENNPYLYRLAAQRTQIGMLAATQARQINLQRQEHRTLQQLLELSNKHDEVDYILRFYRNEYEILPLWYKRLGHIIKVMQGKRSFRSLFDKTVKKYKD